MAERGAPRTTSRDAERERRERLRSERATPRARPSAGAGTRSGAKAGGTATRERHEGLFGWIMRAVVGLPRLIASFPTSLVATLRSFALEVVDVVRGIGRGATRVVPGSERVATASRTVAERARPVRASRAARAGSETDVQGDAPRRALRTAAQVRAAEQRRARLRSHLRLAAGALAVVALVVGWFTVPASDAFRIRHLEVTGASAVGDLEVRERIDPLLAGQTVFTADDDAIARTIEELPFVRDVRVERHLPGGLQVHVSEYRPLALGYGDGKFWLVARDGRILARARKAQWSGSIPSVTLRGNDIEPGDRVGDEPALRLLAARRADSPLEFETIEVARYSLTARLKDGVEIRFGGPRQFRQKLLAAEMMLRIAARKDHELLYVDVTVPGYAAYCAKDVVACGMPRGTAAAAANAAATGDAAATGETVPAATGDPLAVEADAPTDTA